MDNITDARLFDSYYGVHARGRTRRGRSSVLNALVDANVKQTWQENREEDADFDELAPEERDLFKLLKLPEAFVSGFRKSTGEDHSGAENISTRVPLAEESVNDDNDGALGLAFQTPYVEDVHLVPGFFLWHQAFDCAYQQYYYYQESTKQTQWDPPVQGFVPLAYEDVHFEDDVSLFNEYFKSAVHAQSEQTCIPHPKYWAQRHRFFSLYEHGVRLDTESWFSVTPERIANYQAERCHRSLCDLRPSEEVNMVRRGQLVVLDAFCGVAGNTIAFARREGFQVLAYDNDQARLELASHNASVYGVRDSIDFVCDDVIAVLTSVVTGSQRHDTLIDMIFLSPPWGGPEYIDDANFDLRGNFVSGIDLIDLIKLALVVTPNVACFLPRNSDLEPLIKALSPDTASFEIENIVLNGKLKAITLYFGDLSR